MTDFDHRLILLRDRYHASLLTRREAIERARLAYRAHPRSDHAFRDLRTALHRLSGSASAHGYGVSPRIVGADVVLAKQLNRLQLLLTCAPIGTLAQRARLHDPSS